MRVWTFVRGDPAAGDGDEVVFESAQVLVKAVGGGGLEQVAEAFDGVEFGAVGRERQQAHVAGQAGVPGAEVKARLDRR